MSYDARPKSPERLHLEPSFTAYYDPETECVKIHASLTYDTWCCDGAHEVSDAIECLTTVLDTAFESAWSNRVAEINAEVQEALREESLRKQEREIPEFDWVTKDRMKRQGQ